MKEYANEDGESPESTGWGCRVVNGLEVDGFGLGAVFEA